MTENRSKLVNKLLQSIKEERDVDISETHELLSTLPPKRLAAKGLACINLTVESMRTGLGGKLILELSPDSSISMDKLDIGDIKTGDIVKVETQPSEGSKKKRSKETSNETNFIEGVIVKATGKGLSVAVDDKFESKVSELNGRIWVAKLVNPSTYKRMEYALNDLGKAETVSGLHQILLGASQPSITEEKNVEFLDDTLNEPQKTAIRYSLGSDITLIHGPPGTGKTYTLVEIIRQLAAKGERILVCGPSNISVDNVLERLHNHFKGDELVRIGHPARLLESSLYHSLDVVSQNSNAGMVIRDIRKEIDENLGKVSKTKSGRERKEIYNEIKELRKDYRIREKGVLSSIILDAKVVVSTLHGAGSYSIKDAQAKNPGKPLFDTIIIDEVSQSLEPQCWIPLMMCPLAKRLIIAGDNQQLPPTIKSKGKNEKILGTTIFDRLLKLHGMKIKKLLSIQYRMNETIMAFPSQACYDNELQASENVAHRLLSDLPHIQGNDDTETPVLWLDTQGDDYPERASDDNEGVTSRYNENEAALTLNYIQRLLDFGVLQSDIGIISPYSAQVSLLKQLIGPSLPEIEISTVDGFQGREKEVIIMSLVRSNTDHEVGFLAEARRINVAITRPRRHLCIIGNSETLSRSKVAFLKKWVDWAEQNAVVDYPDVSDVL